MGIKGEKTNLVEISAQDGSSKLVESFVSKDAVAEIVEIGTKEADSPKMGESQVQPAPLVTPSVNVSSPISQVSKQEEGLKPTQTKQPIAEQKLSQPSAQAVAKDNKLPQTGTTSAWPITLLGTALAMIGLGGRKKRKG